MKKFLLIVFLFLIKTGASAQLSWEEKHHFYKRAIGVRVAPLQTNFAYKKEVYSGDAHSYLWANYKQFLSRRTAFEVNAGVGKYIYTERKWKSETRTTARGDTTVYTLIRGPEVTKHPFSVALVYSINLPVWPRGMKWIFGFGIAATTLTGKYEQDPGAISGNIYMYKPGISPGTGINGALEYKFKNTPIVIGIDHKLYGFLYGPEGVEYNVGMGARYSF